MDVKELMIGAIMKHMPEDAEHCVTPSNRDYTLSIQWKLKNDPHRPNKYSKKIVIKIPGEIINDFPAHSETMQNLVLEGIEQQVRCFLKNFDPDHISPRGEPEPVECWLITYGQRFG